MPLPTNCTLWSNDATVTHHTSTASWQVGKGVVKCKMLGQDERFSLEAANTLTVMRRLNINWEQFSLICPQDLTCIHQLEDRGFATPAWPILYQLQGDFTTIVGLPHLLAPPFFSHVIPPYSFDLLPPRDAIIVLDACTPEQQISIAQNYTEEMNWLLLANTNNLSAEAKTILSPLPSTILLPPDQMERRVRRRPQFYAKGWWKTGSKTVVAGKAGGWSTWTSNGIPDILPPDDMTPILMPPTTALSKYYLSVTPSGPYMDIPGDAFWVDGSKVTTDDGIQAVGAGGFSRENRNDDFNFRVGGEAAAPRGEIAAATHAVKLYTTPTGIYRRLTIFTDSMMLISVLRRWKRKDFAPRPSDAKHWDILSELLDALRSRKATTTFIWVKAHSSDVYNEMADRLAKQGTTSETIRWERTTFPLTLHDATTGALISAHGWNKAASRAAQTQWGIRMRSYLTEKSSAISTASLLRDNRGRVYLGAALSDSKRYTEFALRSFLQARAGCYPCRVVIGRYKNWSPEAKMCSACHSFPETYGHIQVKCSKTDNARRNAHTSLLESLFLHLESHLSVKIHQEVTAGSWIEDCPAALSLLTPDGVYLSEDKTQLVIMELFRGGMLTETQWQDAVQRKLQTYHGLHCHLLRAYPSIEIRVQIYAVGVLGSIQEDAWKRQLTALKIPEAAHAAIFTDIMRTCISSQATVLLAHKAARSGVG